jgi:hypothetical protein
MKEPMLSKREAAALARLSEERDRIDAIIRILDKLTQRSQRAEQVGTGLHGSRLKA